MSFNIDTQFRKNIFDKIMNLKYIPRWNYVNSNNITISEYESPIIEIDFNTSKSSRPLVLKKVDYNKKQKTFTTETFIRQINFEIDRYVVEGTTGNNEDQYVLFPDYGYNI